MQDACLADGLSSSIEAWQSIQAPPYVLDWISDGVPVPFHTLPAGFHLPNKQLSFAQSVFVQQELNELLRVGAIVETKNPPTCISPIGVVPKRGGKSRLIVDLRKINNLCDVPKFQYDDISVVAEYIQPYDFMVTLDIKSGFHHIPVLAEHQQFLGIEFRGHFYVWRVLPFGLSCSPYYFCKTLRPVISFLRTKGLKVSAYVDDFILLAQQELIQQQTDLMVSTLEKLGWVINMDKSSLVPEMSKEYIGFKIESQERPVLKVPNCRVQKLRKDIKRVLAQQFVKARVLARVIGQCIAMTKAVLPGKLLLRNAYRLLAQKSSWEEMLLLNPPTKADLEWWVHALQSWNGSPFMPQSIDAQIETDASQTGWGAICNLSGHTAAGFWNHRLSSMPSNYREMMAVLLALKSFPHLANHHVQVLTDNITTAAYINHLGGPSNMLSPLANAIWMEAYNNNITLQAKYLPGTQNLTADSLSRISTQYEWQLHPALFRYVDRIFGPHTVDRFASLTTAQLPLYNSLYRDPMSCGVDALAQRDWNQHNNFVNAPFRLIPQVLQLLQQQQATATIIAPHWPGQPWHQKLKNMALHPPLRLPKRGMCHGVNPEPYKNPKWRLYAWKVSGQMN